MRWLTATQIANWAATTLASRHELSTLVANLVRASAKNIAAYRFPTGDSSELPGYDGILEAEAVPPWVPGGKSVWEFGTGDDPQDKATSDFNKRKKNPGVDVVPAETTFVFVTARVWHDESRARWIEARKKEGVWADVVVIDAVDLEAWLDSHPAVASRFATNVLRLLPQEGVRSAADFWDEYAAGTKLRLTEKVLIAGRAKDVDGVRRDASQIPNKIVVRADSKDEALAFVLAAVRSGDDEPRRFFESRALVVDTDDAARRLRTHTGLIIGLRSHSDIAGLLLEANSVIVPLGNDAPNQREAIRLSRASTSEFAEALRTMGLDEEQAERLARESARSVTVLFRRIPAAVRRDPDWAQAGSARDAMVPAMLAGAWDVASPGDRDAIATLAGMPYDEFEGRLRPLLHVADPPLQLIGSVWMVVAPVDLFETLARYAGERNLGAFKQTCVSVLGEIDPAVDLPPEERAYASLHKKVLSHSSWLRDGLTQTVLLIAVQGEFAALSYDRGPQHFASSLIAELPGLSNDHRLIASLERQLPLLMEAAPDPLLEALGRLLEGDGSRIAPIFTEGGVLGPSSYHTGLLFALESLAWDPAYFERAVWMLVRLAKLDPGGKLANRPLNSLHEILLPWLPSTNAPLAMRLRVLDSILETDPEIGWQVLTSLLPSFHGTSMSTSKPRWRDAGASEKEELTRRMVYETYVAAVDRALAFANDHADRWERIIQSMAAFDKASLEKTGDALRAFSEREQPAGVRSRVWSALREEVNRHRRFASADWALSPEILERLDVIVERLRPGDAVEHHAWLFDKYHPELPQPYDKTEMDAADEPRRRAIEAILSQEGPDAVIRLAERAKIPGLVGVAAADVISDETTLHHLLEIGLAGGERLEQFSSALSVRALERLGATWARWVLEGMTRGWTSDQAATAISRWPETRETWTAAAALGPEVERGYWTKKPMFRVQEPEASAAIAKYIEVGRAIEALASFAFRAKELPSPVLLELLDSVMKELATRQVRVVENLGYEIGEVFEELARRDDVERVEIARREYAFLPLLDYRERRLVLHELLVSEPELYVQVLVDVFKPASGTPNAEMTDEQSRRATMGYRLLNSLRVIPGLRGDGSVDEDALRRWVSRARNLAAEADRVSIADHQIGKLLAYAPQDQDGGWPHRAVRELLESLRSDEIEEAIISEQVSKRGVYSKAMFEGGVQERGLAARAREWALLAARWPRTSEMLKRIAAMWDRYAQREDQDAERDKAKFG